VNFCIRDDDTSFFSTPEDLERAYPRNMLGGPVSLAVIPFCRAGRSKGVPEKYRKTWSVHPLDENRSLVEYLRKEITAGRYEAMLHGYYHDERETREEFESGRDLARRIVDGQKYLEDLLGVRIRAFVAPRNTIGRQGLKAIAKAGLHLAGVAGVRSGWHLYSLTTWRTWLQLRRWRKSGGLGVPWVLNLGDHREIAGNPVTPLSRSAVNTAAFQHALNRGKVFCAATHYWELGVRSLHPGEPSVGDQLRILIDLARSDARVCWRSVGDILLDNSLVLL
jgi:hypothetical protein